MNLHARFSDSHHATSAVSYPQFCKERPFWVVSPTQLDREMCLCLTHENMTQMLDALAHLDAIPKNRPSKMLQMVACDVAAQRCMYGECTECGGASIQISCNVDTSSPATWQVWKSVKEQREVDRRRQRTGDRREASERERRNRRLGQRCQPPDAKMQAPPL